jgi:hypothetical protein
LLQLRRQAKRKACLSLCLAAGLPKPQQSDKSDCWGLGLATDGLEYIYFLTVITRIAHNIQKLCTIPIKINLVLSFSPNVNQGISLLIPRVSIPKTHRVFGIETINVWGQGTPKEFNVN